MRSVIIIAGLLFVTPLGAAEDYRVMKLEQDVRTLEREVQTLKRQLFDLEQRDRSVPAMTSRTQHDPQADDEGAWLNASSWNRLRHGMSELEVIATLGKPTALRTDSQNRRMLLYTLEIGTTGFLTGSIAFDAGKAVEIQKPALK